MAVADIVFTCSLSALLICTLEIGRVQPQEMVKRVPVCSRRVTRRADRPENRRRKSAARGITHLPVRPINPHARPRERGRRRAGVHHPTVGRGHGDADREGGAPEAGFAPGGVPRRHTERDPRGREAAHPKELVRALREAKAGHGPGTVAKALADLTTAGDLVNPKDKKG